MPFSDPERHLRDILESIGQIHEFIGEMSFSAYENDGKTRAAVERKLQILTEASSGWKATVKICILGLTGKHIAEWATSCGIPIIVFPMRSFGTPSAMICLSSKKSRVLLSMLFIEKASAATRISTSGRNRKHLSGAVLRP